MASASSKATISTSTDASSYDFSSATYSDNKLYLAFIHTQATTTAPTVSSVSGAGLTFVNHIDYTYLSGDIRRISVWRCYPTSGATTGVVTVTLGGSSQACEAVIVELTGYDVSGSDGANLIVQSAGNWTNDSSTDLTVTLSAFADSANGTIAFFGHRVNQAASKEAGYTVIAQGNHTGPNTSWICEYLDGADTTPSASWASSGGHGGYALELKLGETPVVLVAKPIITGSLLTKAIIDSTIIVNVKATLAASNLSKTTVDSTIDVDARSIIAAVAMSQAAVDPGLDVDARSIIAAVAMSQAAVDPGLDVDAQVIETTTIIGSAQLTISIASYDFAPSAGSGFRLGLDFYVVQAPDNPGYTYSQDTYPLLAKSILIGTHTSSAIREQATDMTPKPIGFMHVNNTVFESAMTISASVIIASNLLTVTASFPIAVSAGPIATSINQSGVEVGLATDIAATNSMSSTGVSTLQIETAQEILALSLLVSMGDSNAQLELPIELSSNGLQYLGTLSNIVTSSDVSIDASPIIAAVALENIDLIVAVLESLNATDIIIGSHFETAVISQTSDLSANAIVCSAINASASVTTLLDIVANSVLLTGTADAAIIDSILTILANELSEPTFIQSSRRLSIIVIEAERIMVLGDNGSIIIHGVDNKILIHDTDDVVQTLNSENTILIH